MKTAKGIRRVRRMFVEIDQKKKNRSDIDCYTNE